MERRLTCKNAWRLKQGDVEEGTLRTMAVRRYDEYKTEPGLRDLDAKVSIRSSCPLADLAPLRTYRFRLRIF